MANNNVRILVHDLAALEQLDGAIKLHNLKVLSCTADIAPPSPEAQAAFVAELKGMAGIQILAATEPATAAAQAPQARKRIPGVTPAHPAL
jgi:hypothetical protein